MSYRLTSTYSYHTDSFLLIISLHLLTVVITTGAHADDGSGTIDTLRNAPDGNEDATTPAEKMYEKSSNQAAYERLQLSSHWTAWRPQRPNTNGDTVEGSGFSGPPLETDRKCFAITYQRDSQIGLQATCPFDFVADYDANRIPERVVHHVCRSGCPSCGIRHACVQLKVLYDYHYRDVDSAKPYVVYSGCVCMPKRIGTPAKELIL